MSKRKAPDSNNPNQEFVDFLIELTDYEKNVSRNRFKHNAYRKAAGALAKLPERIKSGAEAKKLDGIGKQIGIKIDEFIQTGKFERIQLDDGNPIDFHMITGNLNYDPDTVSQFSKKSEKNLGNGTFCLKS